MHKQAAFWIPKCISEEQMVNIESANSGLLEWFKSKADNFLLCLVAAEIIARKHIDQKSSVVMT